MEQSSILEQFPWPERGDRAFVAGNDRRLQAWPGWMPPHLRENMIAEGYYKIANQAIKDLEADRPDHHVDMFFPPIALLYRHFLELSMKSVMQDGMRLGLIENEDVTEYAHRLHDLWTKTREVIEKLNPGEDLAPVRTVERVITEFQRIDKSGQEFRYAYTKDGSISLRKAPQTICLSNLRAVMEKVHNFFSGLDGQISSALDCKSDMEAEYRLY